MNLSQASQDQPSDFTELHIDQQLCLALQISSSLVTRLYRRGLAPLGLTHSQYLVLIALWEAGRPLTMGDLGKGLTQEELSDRCDFDQRYISQVETGQRNLTVLSLYELAQALGTTPVALVTPDEEAAKDG